MGNRPSAVGEFSAASGSRSPITGILAGFLATLRITDTCCGRTTGIHVRCRANTVSLVG